MIEILQNDIDAAPTLTKLYACEMPLRFADMDADLHINNAEFYRFMEEARMGWINTLGLPLVPPEPIPVLAASACSFRAPLHYPGTVKVEIYLGKLGDSSLRTHYLIRNADGELAAEGYAVSVWFDPQAQRTVPLPEALRKLAHK
jgi:acyl-CoA thioester hydrolase